MEKKFGIFNTVEELNRAAAAQKSEGDLEALIGLATENGLEKEDAEEYMESTDLEDFFDRVRASETAVLFLQCNDGCHWQTEHGSAGSEPEKSDAGLEGLYRADADRVSGGSR